MEVSSVCEEKVLAKAGSGTYGTVYVVEKDGVKSVLKVSKMEDGLLPSHLMESQILSGMRHPNLLYGT